jgi:RHS repeat-associated protein
VVTYNTEPFKYRRERGVTYYELSNHLGNVLVTVTDMKMGIEGGEPWVAEYYEATVVSAVDYYPFGSAMAGRKYNQGTYRYGFNGKEEDSEWGSQMIQDYGFRIYNPTIGKFLSVDPLMRSYPMLTPYQFASNMPIRAIDLDGLEADDKVGNWFSRFAEQFKKETVKRADEIMKDIRWVTNDFIIVPSMVDPTGGRLIYPNHPFVEFDETSWGKQAQFILEIIPKLYDDPRYREMVINQVGNDIEQFCTDISEGNPEAIATVSAMITMAALEEGGGKMLSGKMVDDIIEKTLIARGAPLVEVKPPKIDYISTHKGVTVFSDLKKTAKSFKDAGFKVVEGTDGKVWEVPTPDGKGTFYVRLQPGTKGDKPEFSGDRIVTTRNTGNPNNKDYVNPDGSYIKTTKGKGKGKAERRKRGHTHLEQKKGN